MAIEKNYFSTYGWSVDNAYYKIDKITEIEGEPDKYEIEVNIYRDRATREVNVNNYMAQNRFKFFVDRSSFDDTMIEELNIKTQAYQYLKDLTKSFRNEATNV